MTPNQFLKTKSEVINWLDSMEIKNYTINDDLTVDVKDNVKLNNKNLILFPVQFRHVSNTFNCIGNQLTSLLGSPQTVGGSFFCDYNKLKSLMYAPKEVKLNFSCNNNRIKTLDYAPKKIEGNLSTSNNPIQINEFVELEFKEFIHKTQKEKEKIKLFIDDYQNTSYFKTQNEMQLIIDYNYFFEKVFFLKEKALLEKVVIEPKNSKKIKI